MGSTWGNTIKISIFGESHGTGIGVVIDGFPSGVAYDEAFVLREMERRAPGRNKPRARSRTGRKFSPASTTAKRPARLSVSSSATPISARTTTQSWRRSRVPATQTTRVCCATIPATTRAAAAISPAD